MDRYTSVARALHWILAVLIIVNLVLGIGHDALPKDWAVMPVHKSIGLTVLALTLARLAWRVGHRPPSLPSAMPVWEKAAAHATHGVFYAFMILVPATGWIMTSAGTRPLNWFFLFVLIGWLAFGYTLLVAFSVIYTADHWIIDVIAGMAYAYVAYYVVVDLPSPWRTRVEAAWTSFSSAVIQPVRRRRGNAPPEEVVTR